MPYCYPNPSTKLLFDVWCSQAGVHVTPRLPAKPTGLPDAQNKHGWAKEEGLSTEDGKLRTPVLYTLPSG